jgi:tripeptide aminopeptidase
MDPSIIARVLDTAVQIQQVPAPTFMEAQRASLIKSKFQYLGLKDVRIDDSGNVYGRIKGNSRKPAIVVSAHLDTVFLQSTNLAVDIAADKIVGPGIGDNSVGLAALFGLFWAFTETQSIAGEPYRLSRDLWLVANVGEEGLGDLRGMKAVVNRFGSKALVYIILEGMSLGHIYHRGLGVRRYRINVNTAGGHSWIDYGKPSAIHILADLVVNINKIPLPEKPRCALNVGMINGGISVNTIAPHAFCELDIRSEGYQALASIIRLVEALVEVADQKGGEAVRVGWEVIGDRPYGQIPANHPLVKLAKKCYSGRGIETCLSIGSTDANAPLSRGFPAICVGLTTGGGAHTTAEFIHTQPLQQGFAALVDLIQAIDQMEGNPGRKS